MMLTAVSDVEQLRVNSNCSPVLITGDINFASAICNTMSGNDYENTIPVFN